MTADPTSPGFAFGRYELLQCLGAGGMGEVFVARQVGLHGFEKLVVVKVLLPHLGQDPEFVRMFLDEARIAAQLTHPNIAQLFDLGEQDGSYFLAMEFLHGEDLGAVAEAAAAREGLSPALASRIVAAAARGLDYAHRAQDAQGRPLGVVHRDVSPQNLFVTFDGQVKVIDFGIAKAAGRRTSTQAGIVRGKAAYMSPEHATGEPVDGRADLFSLGVVLWELLAGRPLFARETDAATMAAVLEGEVPPLPATVAPPLAAVVAKALAPDPADRYQTAGELARALEGWLSSRPPEVPLSEFMHALFAERLAEEELSGRPYLASRRVSSSLLGGASVRPAEPEAPALPLGKVALAVLAAAVFAGGTLAWRLSSRPGEVREEGRLVIVTQPPGAAVSINGRVIGPSPLRDVPLDPARTSVVEVSRPGYVSQRREVAPGARTTLEITLEEVPLVREPTAPETTPEVGDHRYQQLLAAAVAEKDPRRAEALFREVLALAPDDSPASQGLGLALSRQPGRAQEAIPHLLAGLRALKCPPEVRARLVVGYVAAKDLEEGIRHYLLAPLPRLVPAEAYAALRGPMREQGLRAKEARELERAQPLLAAVAARDPADFPVRLALGQVYEEQGKLREAATEYEACARRGPPGPLVRAALQGVKSVQQRQRQLRQGPSAGSAGGAGGAGEAPAPDPRLAVARAEKDPKRAEALYRELLDEQPGDFEVNRLLGLLVSAQPGREEEALPLLLNALRGPSLRDEKAVRVRLVVGYVAGKRFDEAIREYLNLGTAVPLKVFAGLRGALVEQGLRARDHGELERARQLLSAVAERERANYPVRLALGQVNQKLGLLREAAVEYEACARGAPPGPLVRDALAGVQAVKRLQAAARSQR